MINPSGGKRQEWQAMEQANLLFNFYNDKNWHYAKGKEKVKDWQLLIPPWLEKVVIDTRRQPIINSKTNGVVIDITEYEDDDF